MLAPFRAVRILSLMTERSSDGLTEVMKRELKDIELAMNEPALIVTLENARLLNDGIKAGELGDNDRDFVMASLEELDRTWTALNRKTLFSGQAKSYDNDAFDLGGYRVSNELSEDWDFEDVLATSQGFVVEVDELGEMVAVKHLAFRVETDEDGQTDVRYYGLDLDTLYVETDSMSGDRARALLLCYAHDCIEEIDERLFKEGATLGEQIESLKDVNLDDYIEDGPDKDKLLFALQVYVNATISLDKSVPYSSLLYGLSVGTVDDDRSAVVVFTGVKKLIRIDEIIIVQTTELSEEPKTCFAVKCEIFDYVDSGLENQEHTLLIDSMNYTQSIREFYYLD